MQGAVKKAVCYPRQRERPAGLLPQNYPQPLAASCLALNCGSEHLCFISIYRGHLLATCVLRHQKSLRGILFGDWECSKNVLYKRMVIASSHSAISAFEGFIFMNALSESPENLHLSSETYSPHHDFLWFFLISPQIFWGLALRGPQVNPC